MSQTLLPFAPDTHTSPLAVRSFEEIAVLMNRSRHRNHRRETKRTVTLCHDRAMKKLRTLLAEMPEVLAYLEGRD